MNLDFIPSLDDKISFKIYFNQGRRLVNHEVQIYNICEHYSRSGKFIGKFVQCEDKRDSDFKVYFYKTYKTVDRKSTRLNSSH